MRQELVGCVLLFWRPEASHFRDATLGGQSIVALQELLYLDHVIGKRLGRRIDCGQAAADDHDGHADLQVRHRIVLGCAGELQRHQEVRCLTHAARQPILHRDHCRAASASAERDVIEAQIEGAIDGYGAAEAHATEHRELAAALQQ